VLNFLILPFMIVFLSACGVNTSSSPSEQVDSGTSTDSNTDNTNTTSLDLIDPNPIYSADGNNSDTDTGTDTGGDGTDTGDSGDQSKSVFDVSGAFLDPLACKIGDVNDGFTNHAITDTSADDSAGDDVEYGVLISSKYPYDLVEPKNTEVTLFYYTLKPQRDMNMINIYEDRYKLSVDTAWGRNDKTVMYVMTPKDSNGLYGCYRYEFSNIADGSFTRTKVYRNNI
jgi:gamma-glutamylcyclotransferase (GGCT)/AIG2-like uncharacterized protein YtfP